MQCVRLEDSDTGLVVSRMLQVLAIDARCPEHTPYEVQPGSYLSEDLNPIETDLLSSIKLPRSRRTKK